ncbi:hypothetical protein L7F22_016360 [Adiantum nelumboides]|nr:hypothetical protein [Adiantum nelumboides]
MRRKTFQEVAREAELAGEQGKACKEVCPTMKHPLSIIIIQVLMLVLLALCWAGVISPIGGASNCRDEDEALTLALPCVVSGNVEPTPSAACCDGIKQLVQGMSLGCMCEILISAGGLASPSLLQSYVHHCSLQVPPHFKCKL